MFNCPQLHGDMMPRNVLTRFSCIKHIDCTKLLIYSCSPDHVLMFMLDLKKALTAICKYPENKVIYVERAEET